MTLHVYPKDDLREHITDGDQPCWCRPSVDAEQEEVIVIHNSMDRREEYEQGRKLS